MLKTIRRLIPNLGYVGTGEQIRASVGALLGILVTGLTMRFIVGSGADLPLLVAPIGASAVLLFSIPSSPLAQPWSIIGGNVSAALVGLTCRFLIPDLVVAGAVAVGAAIALMLALRCLHPPGGAVALTSVIAGPMIDDFGYGFALMPVGLNSALLLAGAIAFNNLTGVVYPRLRPVPGPPGSEDGTRPPPINPDDLRRVLERRGQVVDVTATDLAEIVNDLNEASRARAGGDLRCRDLMRSDAPALSPRTSLRDAWRIMNDRGLEAMAVTGHDRTLLGVVERGDFLASPPGSGAFTRLRGDRRLASEMRDGFTPRRNVASIMYRMPEAPKPDTRLVDLEPGALRRLHWPVVGDRGELLGMLSQRDVLAALVKRARNRV